MYLYLNIPRYRYLYIYYLPWYFFKMFDPIFLHTNILLLYFIWSVPPDLLISRYLQRYPTPDQAECEWTILIKELYTIIQISN